MRGLWSTLILVVVLVGLVGYIYFVDRTKPLGDTETREKAFTAVAADDIEELEIKSEDGETSRLRKTDGNWTIVEPISAEPDASELSSLTSSLADVSIERVVDENPSDLKRFGLEPARLEAGFRAKGKKDFNRLLIGDKTPTGGELYARTADGKRVFLVSSFLEGTLNKNTFALRDKGILKFERDKVETLELTSGSTVMQFSKSGTEWKIVKPIAARADFGAVEGVVERLGSARMQSIVTSEDADLKKYGLDKPTATIVVGTGSSRATLTLGTTENAVVFAKDASRPLIFTIAPTIKTDVFKEVAELRRKDLFDSRSFTVNRAELKRGAETLTFERSKGKDDKEIWKDAAGKEVDAGKVQDLLGRLTGLRADSFEPGVHPSLKMPVLTATFSYGDSKMETVTFGRSAKDMFANRTDEPGSAKLDAGSFDEAIKALDAVK